MSLKLNQVLAIEKGVKQRSYATTTELHKIAQQPTLLNGHTKTFEVTKEGTIPQPPQAQKVAYNAKDIFSTVQKTLTDLFDVAATKEWGNQSARADLKVDGQTILKDVPATYLLFLDKQLSDIRDLIGKTVELDPAVDWQTDPNTGLYRSSAVKSHTTQKLEEFIVVVPATEQHPAQVSKAVKDVVVGEWTTTRFSGAIPASKKKEMLGRVQALLDAVKIALEEANMTTVDKMSAGAAVLSYIFA